MLTLVRRCFCRHEYKLLGVTPLSETAWFGMIGMSCGRIETYVCEKCGKLKEIEVRE